MRAPSPVLGGRWRDTLRVVLPPPTPRVSEPTSDAELLAATPNDAQAFGVFYRRHVDNLLGYFWKRCRDHEIASDLTAETFAVVLEDLDRYDPERGNPSQFLYGIASNQMKRFWRRRKASSRARERLEIQTPPTAQTGWQPIEQADARLDAERLDSALSRVPARNREAVRLRVIEDLDYSEIARQLDVKIGTARVRVLRGLRRLEAEFNEPEPSAQP